MDNGMRENVRLNKFLSAAGVCSRRDADRLVEEGRVLVDGKVATLGTRVSPGQRIVCDGREVSGAVKPVLLAVNKPRGIVCTTTDNDRAPNIVDMLHYPIRIYPVGRLDKESDGLILMTNEGELVNRILRARYGHEKEYVCTIDQPVTEEFIRKMSSGVDILDTTTRPCKVTKTGSRSFRIVLTQGLNRQIRRMCEALGCHVRTLKRIRIMNIQLGDLEKGHYREIRGRELDALLKLLDARDQEGPAGEAAMAREDELLKAEALARQAERRKQRQERKASAFASGHKVTIARRPSGGADEQRRGKNSRAD